MRNVLEIGTARPYQPHRTRPPLHGALHRPTIPPAPSCGSIVMMASALALGGLLHAVPAQAIEFGDDEFQGSLDTTISHGLTFRVGQHDPEYSEEVNGNDGDLNYGRGLVSNTSKFTSDLDIQYGDFGAFFRASGFIDFENENGRRPHVDLSEAAKDRVGKNLELLDAYVTGAFEAGDAAVDLRLGKHVLNWGESTFIPNGINAINPFDVSKLRLPGSELREALLPVSMASLAVAPTDTVSIEGFYQFDWEKTEIDPVGSYFSTVDYVGPGATTVFIDDRRLYPSLEATGRVLGVDPSFLAVRRHPEDREPRDSGQWGVALRYLAEELNSTEFGLYYVNYHSRLPNLGVHTGTVDGVTNGLLAFGNAVSPTGPYAQVIAQLTQRFLAQGMTLQQALATAAGVVGRPDAIDAYADTGNYFVEYPENVQLFGLSFNSQLGTSGWALQGEYSYRPDVPLQIQEEKLIELGLEPIIACLTAGAPLLGTQPQNAGAACIDAARRFGLDTDIPGYTRRGVSQFQATATKVFGPALGADGVVFLTETALLHVHDMPERGALPLESPADGPFPADATSFGYRMAARLDYYNAIGGVNLFPYVQWQHDVNGNSPSPIGPFVDDRTALTLGLRADYLSRWQANLGYTRYAGRRNELSDRDFISASIKYSF